MNWVGLGGVVTACRRDPRSGKGRGHRRTVAEWTERGSLWAESRGGGTLQTSQEFCGR